MTPTKVIPREKLSKRKKRELAAKQRGSWGGLNPSRANRRSPAAIRGGRQRRLAEKRSCKLFHPHPVSNFNENAQRRRFE